MKSLFVMDPLHTLHVEGDSTYTLMRECSDRGYEVGWCTPDDLFVKDGRPFASSTSVVTTSSAPFFDEGERQDRPLDAFDVVWMRKDPPFDMSYIFATYILDMAGPKTLVVNDPKGLKLFNEKIWAMHFAEFQPPTLLTKDMDRIKAFVQSQPKGAVLKPWDGNGGRGVLVVKPGDRNLSSMIELLTVGGTESIIAQGFIEGVSEGDKRILLFDGEPVGAILRVPTDSDHRANMHVGATVEKTTLSAQDKAICDALAPHLKAHGQLFVGIDVIAGMLTEINVTSPTGFREVAALYGVFLEQDLISRVEQKVKALSEG